MSFLRHRLLGVVAALSVSVALGACGPQPGTDASAENDGVYVRLNGIDYQMQVSRELNRFSSEDHGYLAGVGNHPPSPQEIWYGVFLRAVNKSNRPQQSAGTFDIRDTQGNVYYPVAVDPASNPYVWTAQTLPPLGTEPPPDTTASYGPTQGALILFKLNSSVYANRPLTLDIHSGGKTATISLNL